MSEDVAAFEHALDLKWIEGYREFLPECICGWVGSYRSVRMHAEQEYVAHVAASQVRTP